MSTLPPLLPRDLLKLLHSRKADRTALALEAQALAAAYHVFMLEAPSWPRSYLSPTRTGVPSSTGASNRREEHLAIALYNAGSLPVADGRTITMADYQMPLQATRRDAGVGKVDLVGVDETGRIVVIELKVDGNLEDRRVGLVEALRYSAAIEANVGRIAAELEAKIGRRVREDRPAIVVAAPAAFWAARQRPTVPEMKRLASDTAEALGSPVDLLSLEGARLEACGLLGSKPVLRGTPSLTAIADLRAAA